MKTKDKIGSMFVVILVLGLLCVSCVSAQSNSKDAVNIDEAKEVASYYVQYVPTFMSDFTEWEKATVEEGIAYYDLEGEKSAYSFNVLNEGEYVGYIMISATRDNYPVLGFSKGKVPNAIMELADTSESIVKTEASKKQLSVESATPLYLGGTFYYMQYSLVDSKGEIVAKKIVDLTSPTAPIFYNESVIEKTFGDEETLKKRQSIKEKEAELQWDSIENRMLSDTESSEVSTRSIGWISGVPNYDWYIGCTPTSAGMVLGYWEDNGYSALPRYYINLQVGYGDGYI